MADRAQAVHPPTTGDDERAAISRAFELEACCEARLDVVEAAFAASSTGDPPSTGAPPGDDDAPGTGPGEDRSDDRRTDHLDRRTVAEALAHGAVAAAFGELHRREGGNPDLAAFADRLASVAGPTVAAPRYLLAVDAESAGRPVESEDQLRAALVADRTYQPALRALADVAVDRGDLHRAISLLQAAGAPDAGLDFLRGFLPALGGARRNDPCPCGSGRKFKGCCQRTPRVPDELRAPLLSYKFTRFLHERRHELIVELATAAWDEADGPDALVSLADDPFLTDLAVFDAGMADDFLAARGALLPEDEQATVARWRAADRRRWVVAGLRPDDDQVVLEDVGTAPDGHAERVVVQDRAGAHHLAVGDLVLARVAESFGPVRFVGIPIDVPPSLVDDLDAMYADAGGPVPAPALAAWYGRLLHASDP